MGWYPSATNGGVMRLESVHDARTEEMIGDDVAAQTRRVAAFSDISGVELQVPDQFSRAFGVCRVADGPDGFGLRALVHSEQQKQQLEERYSGEVVADVVRITARNVFRERQRPLLAGSSIAPFGAPWSGTAGFFAEGQDGKHRLVTNYHVLEGRVGDVVMQPSQADNPGQAKACAVTEALFAPDFTGRASKDDTAFALVRADSDYLNHSLVLQGPVSGFRNPTPEDIGKEVGKAGRTTEVTTGVIRSVDLRGYWVDFGQGRQALMTGSCEITHPGSGAFSAGGDSGSDVILKGEEVRVALLHAGGMGSGGVDLTFALDIERVYEAGGLK